VLAIGAFSLCFVVDAAGLGGWVDGWMEMCREGKVERRERRGERMEGRGRGKRGREGWKEEGRDARMDGITSTSDWQMQMHRHTQT